MTAVVHAPVILAQPAAPTAEAFETQALVQRAQDGDQAAFGVIYSRYRDAVYRFILRRVSGRREVAEDLTQDVFLRAFRRLDGYEWRGRAVGAWLMTIARNLTADYWKSASARLDVPVSFQEVLELGFEAEHGQPEDETLAYLDATEVLAYLKKIRKPRNNGITGDEQFDVLINRFFHGLSVAETAKAMGKNEGAIKALQYRATRSLARVMGIDMDGNK